MNDNYSQIRKNLDIVNNRIISSAAISGRGYEDINIICVSKFQPPVVILSAWEAGIRMFGENYPEQAETKIIELEGLNGIEWHMIGHLQSRKAKTVARHFSAIHSVDSITIAEKLNQLLLETNRSMNMFLEYNVSGEDCKQGWNAADENAWEKLLPDIMFMKGLSNIKLVGLMTMPPIMEKPDDVRPYFIKLRKLKEYINHNLPVSQIIELSMGTSIDYPIAIEEGATYVRIGQAILGTRPVKN
jgi:pyridoxal phosphate enzyme (YggS family)